MRACDASGTGARIANAALRLLFDNGLRGVTGQAVADAAGVSRMTVHRYCPSKEALLRAAVGLFAQVLEEAVQSPSGGDADVTIARLSEAIARLPVGDLPTRITELRDAYPTIHAEFFDAHRRALDVLLDRVFGEIEKSGRLRSDLDPRVVKAFARESLANLFKPSPMLLAQGVTPAGLFATVKEILLHGVVEQPKHIIAVGAPESRTRGFTKRAPVRGGRRTTSRNGGKR